MDEHLALNRACRTDGADFFKAQFPGQDGAGVAQLRQLARTLGRMDAHLGGAVQLQPGRNGPDQRCGSQIVHNHGICTGFGNGAHRAGQTVQLIRVDQCVEGDVDGDTPGMTKTHRLL